MKKMTVAALALTLSLSVLVGCGDKDGGSGKDKKKNKNSDVAVEDVIDSMMDAEEIDSATFEFTAALDVTAEAEGTTADIVADIEGTCEFEGIQDEENMAAYFDLTADVEAMGMSESMEAEAYVVSEDGETVTYVSEDGGDWYTSTEATEIAGEVDEELLDSLKEAAKDFYKDAEVEADTEEVGGEECYVVTLDTTLASLQSVIDVLAEESEEFEDALDEIPVDIEDVLDCIPVSMTMYVSVENGYCMGADVDLSDVDVEELLDVCGVSMSEIGIDSIDIGEISFSYTLSNINDVEVTVPDDVIENAVEQGSTGGGTTTVDPDDYGSPFLNDDGTINLINYSGEVKYVINPLLDFDYMDDYSYEQALVFMNDDWDEILASIEYSPSFYEYMNDEDLTYTYDTYEAEVEDTGLTVDGYPVYCAYETYTYSEGGTTYNRVFVGFVDEDEYFYGVESDDIVDTVQMKDCFTEAFGEYVD